MIIKSEKMTAKQVIDFIGESMEEGDTTNRAYRRLYEEAYGNKLNREVADMWVRSMSVTDGSDRSNGMKWSYDATVDIGNKLGVDWSRHTKCEWYATMNMMYSDYYRSAKKYEHCTDPLYFGELARDWLCDDDAPDDKLYRYYFYVVCCN